MPQAGTVKLKCFFNNDQSFKCSHFISRSCVPAVSNKLYNSPCNVIKYFSLQN